MQNFKKLASAVAVAAAVTFAGSAANAITFVESPDAGGTIATALNVGVGIDRIDGVTVGFKDVFELDYNAPTLFEAFDITPEDFGFFDLLLRNSAGTILDSCFDCFFSDGDQGTTVLSALLGPGSYYLEIDPTFGESLDYTIGITTTTHPATTAVSEPGTLAVLGLGLAGLAYARRRKALKL